MAIGPAELVILLVIALLAVIPVVLIVLVVRASRAKAPTVLVPAATPGWYPDPMGGAGQRYYDGTNWTDQHPD